MGYEDYIFLAWVLCGIAGYWVAKFTVAHVKMLGWTNDDRVTHQIMMIFGPFYLLLAIFGLLKATVENKL